MPRPDRRIRPASAALLATTLLWTGSSSALAAERSMPLFADDMVLAGQAASVDVPFVLTGASPLQSALLSLSYSNSLAVQPDDSALELALNGRPLARLPLQAAQGASRVEVAIPPAAFLTGANTLTLQASQRHRVGCTRDQFQELTTVLHGTETKLNFAFAPTAGAAADLADLAVSAGDDAPVTIAAARDLADIEVLGWGAALAEAIALPRGDRPIAIRAATLGASGVDPAIHQGSHLILVGTTTELQPVLALGGFLPGTSDGALVRALPADPRHLVVAVTGADDAAVERSVAAFGALRKAPPAAPAIGPRTEPQNATFAALGQPTRDLPLGFLGRVGVDLRLPPTLYSGDGQYIDLALSYAYAPGLAASSSLAVLVNGVSANMIRLDSPAGEVVSRRTIRISMKFMHPGLNRIELQPMLDIAAGAECPGERPVLSIFEDSLIGVPPFASLPRGGDLRALAATGFPYAGLPNRTAALVVPHPEPGAVGAAWSLRARLAQRAGAPLDRLATTTTPPSEPADLIVVAATADLPEPLSRSLPDGWAPATMRSAPTAKLEPRDGVADDARAKWQERLRRERPADDGTVWGRLVSLVTTTARAAGPAALPAALPTSSSDTALLMATAVPGDAGHVLTVLAVRDADAFPQAVDRLLKPAAWDAIEGDTATWHDGQERPSSRRRAEPFVIGPLPQDATSLRLAALTFLSQNPVVWIGTMLGALLVLSLVTGAVLKRPPEP